MLFNISITTNDCNLLSAYYAFGAFKSTLYVLTQSVRNPCVLDIISS